MRTSGRLTSLKELKARQTELLESESRSISDIITEAKAVAVQSAAKILLKSSDPLKIIKMDGKINVPGKVFSYLLPLIVKVTLLRRSGLFMRLIVGMATRQIGKKIGTRIFN